MWDVIAIGTATRDAFVRSKEFKLMSSPEFAAGQGLCLPSGAKVDVEDIVFATGGGATNAAVTFARQGFNAAAVCKIGDDVSGREVLANLQTEKVSTVFAVQDARLKTAYSILLLSAAGERTVLVFRGASERFEASDINPRTLKAKWFYVAGSVPLDVLDVVMERARAVGAKVAMNPSRAQIGLGLERLSDVLSRVDVLIVNREEGAYLTNVDFKREEKIFNMLDEYVQGVVVLTDGARGVLVSDGRSIYRAGVYKEKLVADRTGAGDAFGSGFVAGLMRGGDMAYAIKLASANATSVVEHIGAKKGILSREEFEDDPRWRDLTVEVRKLVES